MIGEVIDNRAQSRFELQDGEATATAAYECRGDVIVFTHTVVPAAFRGRGVGNRLIDGALARVRQGGLRVVPQCSFVASYVANHPAEQDLLAPAA